MITRRNSAEEDASVAYEANAQDVLIWADSESDSDLYHATGFLVPDPLAYLELNGEKVLLVRDLEYGRALRESRVDRVVSTTPYEEALRSEGKTPHPELIIDRFLRDGPARGASGSGRRFLVPERFPLGMAEKLRELGWRLAVREDPFFPERTIKTDEEVGRIRRSQQDAEAAMERVRELLARSAIRDGILHIDGAPLTAEAVRFEALKLLLERGSIGLEMIVAGGEQGCDPHQRGSGPLPANETIIVDIFPRSLETRYWGDITRTFVRGKASGEVKRLYRDVLDAQELALGLLRSGAEGQAIHQAVTDFFTSRGDATEERDGRKTGFIHGTGHGVGLDIHELPRMGKIGTRLEAGNVVTVEPGLYYPGVGAVRIEDLVVVTDDGHRSLTTFPKSLDTLEV